MTKEFIKNLAWSEAACFDPIISIFGVREQISNSSDFHNIRNEYNIKGISYHELVFENHEPFRVIDSWDIRLSSEFKKYEEIISNVFHILNRDKYLTSWCMFEGGMIDFSMSFDDWEIQSTYAVISPEGNIHFAFTKEERAQKEWHEIFTEINNHLIG